MANVNIIPDWVNVFMNAIADNKDGTLEDPES